MGVQAKGTTGQSTPVVVSLYQINLPSKLKALESTSCHAAGSKPLQSTDFS